MDRVMVHPEAADAKDIRPRRAIPGNVQQVLEGVHLFPAQSAEEKGLSDDMDKKRNDYINNGMLAMSKALRENNIEQADKLMMKGLSTLYRTLDQAAETLTQYQVSSAARMYAESQSNYHTQVAMAIAGMVAGALLTIISSFPLLRAIFGPLDRPCAISALFPTATWLMTSSSRARTRCGALLGGLKQMQERLVEHRAWRARRQRRHRHGQQ
jgi:methyl-accepting chemotaxis protein-1 (serine sensor receptor)